MGQIGRSQFYPQWGVCYEYEVWFMFCSYHHSVINNIREDWDYIITPLHCITAQHPARTLSGFFLLVNSLLRSTMSGCDIQSWEPKRRRKRRKAVWGDLQHRQQDGAHKAGVLKYRQLVLDIDNWTVQADNICTLELDHPQRSRNG